MSQMSLFSTAAKIREHELIILIRLGQGSDQL
jgi:hypothetical protein